MMRRKYIFWLSLLFVSASINAQVIETESVTIEVIGLKKWTVQKFVDSLKSLSQTKSINICAADIKRDFKFPEASVYYYPQNYGDYPKPYYVVTIVEDDKREKLKYLFKPNDSFQLLKQYSLCDSLITENPSSYYASLQTYYFVKQAKIDSAKSRLQNFGADYKSVKPIWDFLQTKNNIEDLNLALWILDSDNNIKNRRIALSILMNFSEYDVVWWKLMKLQRYEEEELSFYAMNILKAFSRNPKTIDWAPALNEMKHILNGTNLFVFQTTLEVLTKTRISSDLSKSLLNNSSELVHAYLSAKHSITRDIAVKFIKIISSDSKLLSANDCLEWLKNESLRRKQRGI